MTWLTALDRKLLREVVRLKGQIATIALVLASGITCFIALRGTYGSLEWSRDAYYDRARFAHVFARLERAPEDVARRIEALPGVALVQTRVAEEVSLPMEGLDRVVYGRLLSLPASGHLATNALILAAGSFPEPRHDDDVVVLESFARAYGLGPGHRLPVVINGKLRHLRICGVARSPEFVYAIRPGAMAEDAKRYAVLWMERSVVAAAYQLEGSFNDVSLRLQPGASEAATLRAVDRILEPYGGFGAVGRKGQLSNKMLSGEFGTLGVLGTMVPLVFLGVAAFLINMVLARLIALQRTQIATLKAVGYTNGEIGRHYLALVAVVMVPSAVLGVSGGFALGRAVLGLYEGIFRFPELRFRLSPALVAVAVLVSALSATLGASFSVRAAARLQPAEAMRPPAPAHYRRGLVARLGLGALVGPAGMMVVREIERRPLRTLLSAVGIAGAIALVILGHFGTDSLDNYLESMFRREQRQDLAVAFARPVPPRAVSELGRLPGVIKAEGIRAVPIRVRHDNRMRDSVLMGLPTDGTLRRLVAHGGREVPVPADGVLVTAELGKILGLRAGDRVEVEVLEGERPRLWPAVAGFVDETVGLQLYARAGTIARLEGDAGAVSSILLSVDRPALPSVERWLRQSPRVVDISEVSADVQRLRDMNQAAMDIWTAVSITLGACVIFGVVYNNARIALALRSRELASLRVLGLSRGEISSILIAGLAFEVLIAIPLGLLLGRVWADLFFTRAMDQEIFRFQVLVEGRTYVMAAVTALFAGAVSALWVRRSLDRLDLIEVLKTRE